MNEMIVEIEQLAQKSKVSSIEMREIVLEIHDLSQRKMESFLSVSERNAWELTADLCNSFSGFAEKGAEDQDRIISMIKKFLRINTDIQNKISKLQQDVERIQHND